MTKEEKKDEMKNRISLALKDPILQQGFEIICKNLVELENKIADIKANCDLAIEGRDMKIKELEQELTVEKDQLQEEINLHLHAEEYIKSLEKENTELKGLKDVATLIRANNDTVVTLMQLNNMLVSKSQQLTKAKELLAKWVELYKPKLEGYPITPIQEQTEQFLKGENIILEDAQAGNSPFDADEVFNKEMKAYLEGKVNKEIEK